MPAKIECVESCDLLPTNMPHISIAATGQYCRGVTEEISYCIHPGSSYWDVDGTQLVGKNGSIEIYFNKRCLYLDLIASPFMALSEREKDWFLRFNHPQVMHHASCEIFQTPILYTRVCLLLYSDYDHNFLLMLTVWSRIAFIELIIFITYGSSSISETIRSHKRQSWDHDKFTGLHNRSEEKIQLLLLRTELLQRDI